MCITKLSKHPECEHWSCEIIEPCKEGRDFSNCPSFEKGIARNPAKYKHETAKEKTCPKCDKDGEYDGKKIRMVKGTVHAKKIGSGPSRSDCGINLGRKSRKYGPKKEAQKMVLTEGGCAVM